MRNRRNSFAIHSVVSPLRSKSSWTAEEDEVLLELVAREGPRNWSFIAKELGTGRSSKSCRLRYVLLQVMGHVGLLYFEIMLETEGNDFSLAVGLG